MQTEPSTRVWLWVAFLLFILQPVIPALAQEIVDAVKRSDVDAVAGLLEKAPELAKIKDAEGSSLLHLAVQGAQPDLALLTILIDKGAAVNAADADGRIPLHHAASRAQPKVVAFLLSRGSQLDALDGAGKTPLAMAATQVQFGYFVSQNKKDAVNLLVEAGAKIPASARDADALLHIAAASGYPELAGKLLDSGIGIATSNRDGGSLLHSAATGGSPALIGELVKRGLKVNRRNRYGLTPLHLAAMLGRKEAVAALLHSGADINARCQAGKTALNHAQELGYREVAAALIAKGADQRAQQFPVFAGPYLGQRHPGDTPEVFLPGIVSTIYVDHSAAVFSPDGNEVYWTPSTRRNGAGPRDGGGITYMKQEGSRWTAPRVASFSGPLDFQPGLSPDGRTLFFSGGRPLNESVATGSNIWRAGRDGTGWSAAKPLGEPVNTGSENTQCTADRKGTIYFASTRPGGMGQGDIFFSRLVNGRYETPVNLGAAINSEQQEYSPFIDPDGRYLIFSSNSRPDAIGDQDLYISFCRPDGSWRKAVNMGRGINEPGKQQYWPAVSPDGKFLFFGSNRDGNFDIYWVGTAVIDRLRKQAELLVRPER